MKLAIMDFFTGVELYEGYGSTEAGIVTVLKPEDQMSKLGSIGFEAWAPILSSSWTRTARKWVSVRLENCIPAAPCCSRNTTSCRKRPPQRSGTAGFPPATWPGGEDGFYEIVDRKDNMIITGGEHVYPSEVEEAVGSHECVFDCACIGLPDEKWGERVVAVVVPKPGVSEKDIDESAIKECCRNKLSGFKRPKDVIFIRSDDMPRTPTGKILHRKLREKFRKPGGNRET